MRWSVLLIVLVNLLASYAWAIDDPSLKYHTITTPNFYIHYYDGVEDLAWKVAVTCEEAHAIFSPLLEWQPANRTHVNINDKSDVANGSATTYGRNTMNIYGMPPESDSVLGFYDDWLRVLVYHEYVHILHLDTVGGISPYINVLIGKQLSPNQTAPRWYIEGFATYHESARTRGGRVSGSTWNMWSRMAALDGVLLDLGGVTGAPTQWPGGNSAYLFGSLFFEYVFDQYGEDFGNQFNREYGSRIIPWSLNQTAEEITGQTIESMWNAYTAHAMGKAQAERLGVVARGETSVKALTRRAGSHGFARPRPGDTLTFFHFDHESSPAYFEIGKDGRPSKLFEIVSGAGPAAWTPDGQRLVFSQSNVVDTIYSYQDLFVWDARTKIISRMTTGERARDPAISPDGKHIVYVRHRAGTMELVLRDFNRFSQGERVLLSGLSHGPREDARWQQISAPRFSPDGKTLVFSWWRLDVGQRDIWTLDIAEGSKPVQRTDDFALDVDPIFDGAETILFASDRTGIFNIFALNLKNGTLEQRTDVVGGVTGPTRAADQSLWVTSYTSDGYELGTITERPRPADSHTVQDDLPQITYPVIDTSTFEVSSYNPAPWLGPLFFSPEFGLLSTGSAFGGVVVGFDPVGHHNYTLGTALTTGRELTDQGFNLLAQYQYLRLPANIGLLGRYRRYPQQRGYYVASDYQTYMEDDYTLRGQISFPFRGILESFSLSLSLQMQHVTFEDLPTVIPDPGDITPIIPEEAWLNSASINLGFVHARRYPRSISTEKGVTGSLSLSLQNPFIGSDVQALTLSYSASGFVPVPWTDRHVLSLSLAGGHVSSPSGRTGQYSLGGALPQDVLTSVLFQEPAGGRVLRGYPPAVVTGPNYQLWTLEYRFPLLEMDQGFGTLPVYFRQLKGSLFSDAGTAYEGYIADASLLPSVGTELVLSTIFAYYLSGNLRFGYAYGLGAEGIHDLYLRFGGGF